MAMPVITVAAIKKAGIDAGIVGEAVAAPGWMQFSGAVMQWLTIAIGLVLVAGRLIIMARDWSKPRREDE